MAMFDSVWHLKELSMSRISTAILKRVRCLSDHQLKKVTPRECDRREREPSLVFLDACQAVSRLEYFSYTHRRKCWMAPYRQGAFPDLVIQCSNLCAFKFSLRVVD